MNSYREILINLVKEYRNTLTSSHEYVVCHRLAKKINDFVYEDKTGTVRINYDKLTDITKEEILMFSSPDCEKIIRSFSFVGRMRGITDASILKNINVLKEDLINHKLKTFHVQEKSLDTILSIINEEEYKENYKLILDFIKMSFDNNLIDVKTAIDLNFYILKKCNDYGLDKVEEEETEFVILEENLDSVVDIRKKLEQIFSKYGYIYDRKLLDRCGGEEYFVEYAKVEYVDYVLSKFKRYGITQDELYAKKTFYNIIIDRDKQAFNSILDFVDHNDCSLGRLLYLPSVFARRKREYLMHNKRVSNRDNDGNGKSVKISGCNVDFFKNIKLYKKLKGVDNIDNVDLDEISKYLSTPYALIERNMNLLLKYGILTPDRLPDSIVSLCGIRTEYLIDRFIEASLFEPYLLPKVSEDGVFIPSVGTSRLYLTTSDLMFYKIKRAQDVGDSVLHSNGGLRRIFRDDREDYMGIRSDNGKIIQEPMTMEQIDKIDLRIKKYLPGKLYPHTEGSWDDIARLEFNNLYRYGKYSPVDIFRNDSVKGKLYERIFEEDYKSDLSFEDVLEDEIIKLLDNATYCDVYGTERPIKVNEYQYEFSHPSYPNIRVVISRYKVLRLCKLLCENDCWIGDTSSLIDKENSLLSIVLKDTILCDYEMSMVRFVVREILKNGLIKVSNVNDIGVEKRGAR